MPKLMTDSVRSRLPVYVKVEQDGDDINISVQEEGDKGGRLIAYFCGGGALHLIEIDDAEKRDLCQRAGVRVEGRYIKVER